MAFTFQTNKIVIQIYLYKNKKLGGRRGLLHGFTRHVVAIPPAIPTLRLRDQPITVSYKVSIHLLALLRRRIYVYKLLSGISTWLTYN